MLFTAVNSTIASHIDIEHICFIHLQETLKYMQCKAHLLYIGFTCALQMQRKAHLLYHANPPTHARILRCVQRGLIEGEQLIMLPFPKRSPLRFCDVTLSHQIMLQLLPFPKRSPSSSFCDVTLSHQIMLQLVSFSKPSHLCFCDVSHDVTLPDPKSSPFCYASMML